MTAPRPLNRRTLLAFALVSLPQAVARAEDETHRVLPLVAKDDRVESVKVRTTDQNIVIQCNPKSPLEVRLQDWSEGNPVQFQATTADDVETTWELHPTDLGVKTPLSATSSLKELSLEVRESRQPEKAWWFLAFLSGPKAVKAGVVTINIPHGLERVRAQTRAGDLSVACGSEVEVESVSGALHSEIGLADAVVSLRSTSGDIRAGSSPEGAAGSVRELNIQSTSGSVHVHHQAELLQVTTVSGDVHLFGTQNPQAKVHVRSVSGDVELASKGMDLAAESVSGNLQVWNSDDKTRYHAYGEVGPVSPKNLDIVTVSGNIRIREAGKNIWWKTVSGSVEGASQRPGNGP